MQTETGQGWERYELKTGSNSHQLYDLACLNAKSQELRLWNIHLTAWNLQKK